MTFEEAIETITLMGCQYSHIRKDDREWEALQMAIEALKFQHEVNVPGVLQTIYETPETCPHCFEHLSLDWSFCPECGRTTPWNKQED